MITSAIVAYLHYLGLMLSFAALFTEALFFKKDISLKEAKLVGIADIVYGIAASTILVTGILRVLYFGKGSAYYLDNSIFWVKIAIFIGVGLLSLYPTVTFVIWWIKDLIKDQTPVISDTQHTLITWSIRAELLGFCLIPLTAALMARISV
jgi:putative membrane protein